MDNLSGAVTQNGATIINAGTLTGNTGSTVALGNANTLTNVTGLDDRNSRVYRTD